MSAHAILSPSTASQWCSCNAAPAMQLDLPEHNSAYAAQGTAMHMVADLCLKRDADASLIGSTHPATDLAGEMFNGVELTHEDAATLQAGYLDPVRAIAQGGVLLPEQRLSITHITGEENAYGTADVVIFQGDELIVVDLKWGMGVRVEAVQNKQLAIYALAALEEFSMLADFKTVRMMIFMPRLQHDSEWVVTVDELRVFGDDIATHARTATGYIQYARAHGKPTLEKKYPDAFTPSEDNCRFCKASGNCKAQTAFVFDTIGADFDVVSVSTIEADRLAHLMPQIGMIEAWCKAVTARGEAVIHAGGKIPGYKLVQGKRGNRAWVTADDAERAMKSMRLKVTDMYSMTVIGPAPAEKLLAKACPRKWKKLQSLIVQRDGQPTVVPDSDKRSAINVADDF